MSAVKRFLLQRNDHVKLGDSNICPLFGGVRCREVSVDGGSTVTLSFTFFIKKSEAKILDFIFDISWM